MLRKSSRLIPQFQIVPEKFAVYCKGIGKIYMEKWPCVTNQYHVGSFFFFFRKAGGKWQDISHIHRSLTCKSEDVAPAQEKMHYWLSLRMELALGRTALWDIVTGKQMAILSCRQHICSCLTPSHQNRNESPHPKISCSTLQLWGSWDMWILKEENTVPLNIRCTIRGTI